MGGSGNQCWQSLMVFLSQKGRLEFSEGQLRIRPVALAGNSY